MVEGKTPEYLEDAEVKEFFVRTDAVFDRIEAAFDRIEAVFGRSEERLDAIERMLAEMLAFEKRVV